MLRFQLAASTLLLGLAAAPAFSQQSFADATSSAGLVYKHKVLAPWPMQQMAGGASAGDFDRDGWVDLYLPSDGIATEQLFINQQDGTFVDQAASFGLTGKFRGVGCNAADFDGDGWIDIYVTSMGSDPAESTNGVHRLYHNNGGTGFTDVAVAAGVASTNAIPDGYGPSWGDYDLDGDLDLWVGGWHHLATNPLVNLGTRLFRNEGDGTFTDVTVSSGVFDFAVRSFAAIFVDQDGDRYPELHVAADFGTGQYFKNNRDGTFTKLNWFLPNGDKVHNGMGTAIGDFDRDGDADWFVTAIFPSWKNAGPPGNRLYMNDGQHHFTPLPPSGGVDDGGWGWAAAAQDFNHDGWTDLVHTNGWPQPDPVTGGVFTDDPTVLFINNGDNTFSETAMAWGLDHTGQGRGLLTFDPDRDGDMDVLICTNKGDLQYFRNDLSGAGTHWLKVWLDTTGHPGVAPDGIGARLVADSGAGVVQTTWITGCSNFQANSELVAHFGFGDLASLPRLEVHWPDGFKTVLNDVALDQELTVAAVPPYSHTPLVGGQVSDLVVAGLEPGEVAVFLVSVDTSLAGGTCYPFLGDLCVDLVSPFQLGYAFADASGTASFAVPIPAGLPPVPIASQAVVPRGPGFEHSLKTNAIVATVQ
ncbi:CRTAC1 family protein [Engelhardtia mirabilis]|uniref:ASPIC and UnbV n=1 Tax=Engelhardtia mirabilis TaxID=2528011 RepID=A0A518BRR8_9BACT|nr:ASPIC and UnbV [Planctomycetes bacterium Pla133]QDV03997.1 ASPIC and UnbV [Planctomycetes bacterium Pla86]